MTDTALVRRHEALSRRISKLVDKLCDEGFGTYKFTDLRALPTKPKFVETYLALVDESVELRYEAERRYGPGMLTMRQLLYRGAK
jgi:hypothetical protein